MLRCDVCKLNVEKRRTQNLGPRPILPAWSSRCPAGCCCWAELRLLSLAQRHPLYSSPPPDPILALFSHRQPRHIQVRGVEKLRPSLICASCFSPATNGVICTWEIYRMMENGHDFWIFFTASTIPAILQNVRHISSLLPVYLPHHPAQSNPELPTALYMSPNMEHSLKTNPPFPKKLQPV